MRFNSIVSEEPYLGLKLKRRFAERQISGFSSVWAGAAWLPSARVLRCTLKWENERNPHRQLQVSGETALIHREEGEDDVKSAWPFDTQGDTHVTMASTMGCEAARWS